MAHALQTVLDATVAADDARFVIAMTGNGDGVTWSGVSGDRVAGRPAALDTVFRFYSMTKAVGTAAATILIDRGQLDLDTPVVDALPEIGALQVLEGFDGSTPRLRAPKRPITVRHLATHTSGLAYRADALEQYFLVTGAPSYFSRTRAGLNHPLLFDPGEGWAYGTGIDWLGLLVERIDGRPISRFCQQEIFDPLGMKDTCFEPGESQEERLCSLYVRDTDGGFTEMDGHFIYAGDNRPNEARGDDFEYHGMGGCLFGTVPDYMRLLRMYLNGGALDGIRIIGEPLARRLQQNLIGDIKTGFDFFPGTLKSHAFSFMRLEEDMPGRRAAGSCHWAGGANGHYWIDFRNDIIGIFATCSAPFLDPRFMAQYAAFERQVYSST